MARNHPSARWGTRTVQGLSGFGVVTAFERSSDLLAQNETDETGSVCRVVAYDCRTRVVATIQADRNATPPKPGTSISIDGESLYIVHSDTIEKNSDFVKFRITAERYKKVANADSAPGMTF